MVYKCYFPTRVHEEVNVPIQFVIVEDAHSPRCQITLKRGTRIDLVDNEQIIARTPAVPRHNGADLEPLIKALLAIDSATGVDPNYTFESLLEEVFLLGLHTGREHPRKNY